MDPGEGGNLGTVDSLSEDDHTDSGGQEEDSIGEEP